MNPESIRAVTLVLGTGERFKEVPVGSVDVTLAQFLDQALKTLEVSRVAAADGHIGSRIGSVTGYSYIIM